jgi:hypothetical protein
VIVDYSWLIWYKEDRLNSSKSGSPPFETLIACQLYLLPDLLEEMDCKEDTPLRLPVASFVSLSQLIIVI